MTKVNSWQFQRVRQARRAIFRVWMQAQCAGEILLLTTLNSGSSGIYKIRNRWINACSTFKYITTVKICSDCVYFVKIIYLSDIVHRGDTFFLVKKSVLARFRPTQFIYFFTLNTYLKKLKQRIFSVISGRELACF